MADFLETLVQRVRHWSIVDYAYRIRWVLVGFVVLILVAIPWGLRSEERGLEDATRQALAEAGFSAEAIEFSGRSGTVTAQLTDSQLRRATAVVAEVGGVRSVEFVQLDAPVTQTPAVPSLPGPTTVTPEPPNEAPVIVPPSPIHAASLVASIEDARLIVSGTLPSAERLAELTRVSGFYYRGAVTNTMLVDDRVAPEASLEVAADLLAMLPMVSRGVLEVDAGGAVIDAVVASEAAAELLAARLEALLGPEIPVGGTISVSAGSLPTLDVAVVDGRATTISGFVNNEALKAGIVAELEGLKGVGDAAELVVDPLTMQSYPSIRAPRLLRSLIRAGESSLVITGATTEGTMSDGETWVPESRSLTAPIASLVPDLAAMVLGDPTLHLTIEIDAPPLESGEPNVALNRARAERLELNLMRAGVEPSRMTIGFGDDLRSSLWFRLAPADDGE